MIKVIPTRLQDVMILEYGCSEDNRGLSYSTLSKKDLYEVGIMTEFIQENIYCPNKKGTLYGIHFQNNPMAQTKLLYCIEGRGLDYSVDLRKNSKTYKQWVCVELSAENKRQVYVPKGFGHAFLSMEDNTKVVMRIDNYFHQDYRRGIAWNDTELGIDFPVEKPILSKVDEIAPLLRDSDCIL